MTRRARFVESTTFRRRCPSVFMSGGKLSRTDDLAHAARFLSNVIWRCNYNLIKEFRSLLLDEVPQRCSLLAARNSGSLVGSRSCRGIEQFHQARLVRITQRRIAIWLDPFGMLDPQIIVDLSQ